MKFAIFVFSYCLIGACAYAWSNVQAVVNPSISFALFIAYAIFCGLLCYQLDKRGVLV